MSMTDDCKVMQAVHERAARSSAGVAVLSPREASAYHRVRLAWLRDERERLLRLREAR